MNSSVSPGLSKRQLLKAGLITGISTVASLASTNSLARSDSSIQEAYSKHDAVGLADLVRQGQLSTTELLDEAIRRAEQLNPRINAIVAEHYDFARRQLAGQLPDGPFSGVPFLLKDLGAQLNGTVTTGGSRLLKHAVARTNSTLVQRYLQAGLVVFGKTNTPEFGLALTTENLFHGDCLNPWNTAHSTGGSSGGSAAAVASGIVPVAHATDGGGSIRVPAAHCGLFGFKPSRGLTPGVSGAAMSIGHVVSRSVRDSAVLLDASAGYEAGAPYWVHTPKNSFSNAIQHPPRKLRIAMNLTTPAVTLHPDCRQSVTETAKLLTDLGHSVDEAAPEIDFERLNDIQNILMTVGVSASLRQIEQSRGMPIKAGELEPMTEMVRRAGQSFSSLDHAAALQGMHEIGLSMGQFMQDYDVILQPVTATPAPKLNTITYRDGDSLADYTTRFKQVSAFTHQYNMSGQPSMSVPLAMSQDSLPIGVMFSGRVGEDALLFALAAQLERAQPWIQRRPAIWL